MPTLSPSLAPQCLVTGASLYVPNERKCAHGDLHRVGDAFVFNACLGENGQTAWMYNEPVPSYKGIVCDSNFFFERRGVIVMPAGAASLNPAAEAYIAKVAS